MNSSMIGGMVAVAAVIVVGLLLRGMSSGKGAEGGVPAMPPPPPQPEPERSSRDADERSDDEGDGIDERLVVAVSSDGRAFVPDLHVVRVLPPPEEGDEWKVGSRLKAALEAFDTRSSLHPGDLHGVRVVRGEFDEGPWLLEALGRDGEYLTFPFETSEAANAAKVLFERLDIVKLGEDEDGRPMPPSAEQFAEARRIYLETAAQLELPDEEDSERHEGTP
jgi:hypothetical protein